MSRIYSIRRLHNDQPFTVIDDHEAEYYRDAGFIVTETKLTVPSGKAAVVLFISVLIAGFFLSGYLFGYNVTFTTYLAFGGVYGLMWLVSK